MKLKAFLSSYLLFLFVLFIVVITISTYMTNSQMNMIRDKSTREYQTISASLTRDIAVAVGNAGGFNTNFDSALDRLIRGYIRYYSGYNIELILTEIDEELVAEVTVIERDNEHFIHITGNIHVSPMVFRLDYYLNISENITDLRNIQSMLLFLSVLFCVLTAVGLYIILLRIFKPVSIITKTSSIIASGNYNERIIISGDNELTAMAESFNKMVDEIELQIVGKQQFIDNFTHEIRTPLTSIYGYAEYMQKAPYDATLALDATQTIMDEASHIKMIASSLLNLSTLRNYSPVNINISVEQLFNDIQKALGEKTKFISCIEADSIIGQEDLIKSLVMNLCVNSINAGASEIVLKAEQPQEGTTVLSVADNGCGISSDDLKKVTEPFFRVDKARSRAQGGIGLGLSLCKQIADVHGAVMSFDSVLGEGTVVCITFTTP